MMKKRNIVCTLSIILLAVLAFSRTYATASQPHHCNDVQATLHLLSTYNADAIGRDSTTPVKEQDRDFVFSVFEDISKLYGVEKSKPNIAHFHPHDNITSQYSKGCIYINFLSYANIEDARGVIAHELIHYLTDNGQFTGFRYTLDDTYILGQSLSEGVTTYFSTKYAPDSAYPYETHVAKLVSICYGEERLKNDFFSTNVSNLRNDFNRSLKKHYPSQNYGSLTLTPFDLMTCCLNTYGDSTDDSVQKSQMLAVEEMFLYYAKSKGYESEVKEEISNFATNNSLDFLIQLL